MAGPNAGRRGRRWRRLREQIKTEQRPCCLCGQPIDYDADPLDPNSFTVEHRLPLSTHPHLAEDPANLDAAHRRCNTSRGNRAVVVTLGRTSRHW